MRFAIVALLAVIAVGVGYFVYRDWTDRKAAQVYAARLDDLDRVRRYAKDCKADGFHGNNCSVLPIFARTEPGTIDVEMSGILRPYCESALPARYGSDLIPKVPVPCEALAAAQGTTWAEMIK